MSNTQSRIDPKASWTTMAGVDPEQYRGSGVVASRQIGTAHDLMAVNDWTRRWSMDVEQGRYVDGSTMSCRPSRI